MLTSVLFYRMATVMDVIEFVTRRNVPTLCECDEETAGKKKAITAEEIDEIAAVNNRLVAQGEPPVIHIGHTDGTDAEKPILGFAKNFTTGLRDGIKTLFCDWDIFPEKEGELRYYPRRSAEVYLRDAPDEQRWVMPSIALVGSNQPALKLGVLYRNQNQKHLARFIMQDSEKPVDVDADFEAKVLSVFSKTDIFAFCRDQMAKMKAEEEGKKKIGEEEEESESGESEGEESMSEEEKEKFTTLSAEVSSLKKKLRTSERVKKFTTLEAQGYAFDFDSAKEVAECDDMTDEQFDKHIARITKFTKQAPVSMKFTTANVSGGGSTSQGEIAARAKKIGAHARSKGITFEQAERELACQ